MNSREDWYSANKDRIFPDFGSLQSAEMSIDGLAPRTGEAYADMRLTQVESGNRPAAGQVGDYNVALTYETLGSSFVQVKDDNTDYELNGLRRVTRTSIAEAGTDYARTVGSSYIDHQIDAETAVRCFLASYGIDDTDSFRQVQEVYVEAGTLSETLDNVGSQKAKVIETIGADPATPDGYSLASKQESDFEGFQTNRFTFLKNNVVLSESEDKVGSQLAITQEVFNGTPTTPSGYSIANTQESDVDGIPTKRFTFLKNNVVLSVSEDKVGSQNAVVNEVFNPTTEAITGINTDGTTLTGYSEANRAESDYEGIKTIRVQFLKDDVELSRSEDKVGSQLAITTQIFNPTEDPTETDYSLARTEVSDVDGIPTKSFTLLKDDVELSRSEDLVGSQLAIVTQVFNPTEDPTEEGYSLASTEESDVDGIPTERFTFLKDNVELSRSEDKVGSQLAITTEVFNPTEDPTEVGYSVAREEVSDVDGIPTNRYTFLKNNVILSETEDKVGSELAIVQEWFNPTEDPTIDDYVVANTQVSDVGGIPTKRFTFLKDNVELSRSEDKVGSQLAIVTEVFNPTEEPVIELYVIGSVQVSDVEGIPTKRYTFLKDNILLSESEDKVGSQLAKVQEWFNPTEEPTIEEYVIGNVQVSDVDGIPTKRYTFLKDNVQLSESEDKVGSQLAKIQEWFNPTDEPEITDYVVANVQVSDVDGIPTKRFTFLKDGVELSRSEDKVGSQLAIITEVFNPTDDPVETDYSLAKTEVSDVDGIPTKRFTFLKDNVVLSESEDKVGSQLAIVKEVFNGTPTTPAGYLMANTQKSDVEGIPTSRYTFLKPSVLSESTDNVGSQKAKVIETFSETPVTPTGYSLANTQVSDFEGIKTNRYTFLKDNVELSRSEDRVGSQLAITTQVFNPTSDPTEAGYSVAREEVSEVDGIPTKRFTFLKPSILSLQQEFNNGLKQVSVQAFGMTATAISSELSAVTTDHELISQNESDYEGIKTSTFQYQIDESITEDYELNGLKSLSITELSSTNFTARDIGVAGAAATPQAGLYLGAQDIDNGGAIKVRQSTWVEAGVISVSTDEDSITDEVVVDAMNLNATQVRTAVAEVTANHNLKSQSISDFEGLKSFKYVFEIRSTTTETELGDSQIGVNFFTGIQTDGSSDFIIERQYSITSSNVASSIKKLLPPEINDPVFDGTGGTQKAYIVDQEVKPNGQDGAVLTRTFAMLPSKLDEWDEMVVRFPGVERGPFQLDEGFDFRSEPFSEAVPVRICREFFLSNPQRICRPSEFRPVDANGNRVTVLTADTVPTADEYIGYVNSGKYLNDRVSIHRWQGDIWERRIVQFKAE
jgi:hypothetical protein